MVYYSITCYEQASAAAYHVVRIQKSIIIYI